MKECDDKQIYSISTNRCINIDSPTFNKRLKEQLEKNVKHFNSSDLKKLGYKVKGGGVPGDGDNENKNIKKRKTPNSSMNTNAKNVAKNNTPQNVANNNRPQNVAKNNLNISMNTNAKNVAKNNTPQNVTNNNTPQNVANNNRPQNVANNNLNISMNTNAKNIANNNRPQNIANNNRPQNIANNNRPQNIANNNRPQNVNTNGNVCEIFHKNVNTNGNVCESIPQHVSAELDLTDNIYKYTEESLTKANETLTKANETLTNANETLTNAEKKLSDKMMNKLINWSHVSKHSINECRYVDDNHKSYCNNGKKTLLNYPLITKKISYDFTYLKSILQDKFNTDMLLYMKKNNPWDVALISHISSPIKLKLLNYDRMNLMEAEENNFMDQLDIEWFNETNKYVSNLNIEDLFALKGYTFKGDVLINNKLRGSLDMKEFLKTISTNLYSNQNNTYFPLFFPILKIIFRENDNKEILIDNKKIDMMDKKFKDNATKSFNCLINNINAFKSKMNQNKKCNTHLHYFLVANRKIIYRDIVILAHVLKNEYLLEAIDILTLKVHGIIQNSPPTTKKMIVYRGDKDDIYFNDDKKSVFFKNKGIISTTLSYANATNFIDESGLTEDKTIKTKEICCMKEITILPGSRILFVGGVSSVPREIEFLLGMNTIYLMRKYRDKAFTKDYMLCGGIQTDIRPKMLVTRLVALENKDEKK
jgi:hypothetical protein